MQIVEKSLNEIKPYEKNPRKNDGAVEAVAASIREFGFKVPIVIDASGVIVCGHTRYKAAKKLKMNSVPCVIADDLTDEQIRAFRLADNKTGDLAEWDDQKLMEELSQIEDIDMSIFHFFDKEHAREGTRYSDKSNVPQYEITGERPPICDLFNKWKYENLVSQIDESDIPDEEKDFLRMAATRHIVFNYTKIAEHYADATPEVQRLMEKSALVIIDLDDAIANGFTTLSSALDDLREEDENAG